MSYYYYISHIKYICIFSYKLLYDYYYYYFYKNQQHRPKLEKTNLFISCFRNPTSTCATENRRKHNLAREATNG